ncbi:aldehyde dehydrogenase [Arthrobacter sp. UYEF3]|uniref:aldehyde dehydrogenase n=1 Tax=Arthrobacter sp. UYEF3 TaxID=1756365 RepID=UPI00339324F3
MMNFRMTIGSRQAESSDGKTLPATNPYTGEIFATIPDATAQDTAEAIGAAKDAFDSVWSSTNGYERSLLMNKLADILDANASELGKLESTDNGKLVTETTNQARFAARMYRFYAGQADKIFGSVIPVDRPGFFDYTRRVPVGVAVLITAWNSPMQLLSNKLAPALAAGNTVVVKPSEHASASTLKFADYMRQAGFPDGVFNVVTGGPHVGEALTTDRRVGRISFTGSVQVGQAIQRAAASTLIPVTLELGGKSPNIIFDDADIQAAVKGAAAGIFGAGGQSCIAGSRLLVQRGVYERVVAELAELADAIRLGNPAEAGVQMGPVANKPQHERITSMVREASRNATMATKGGRDLSALGNGLFVEPVVFRDVANDSDIARHEVFGPVLSIIPFDTEEEAIAMANDSEFGLASGVWTQNLGRAHRVADRIEAGTVWVNTYRVSQAQAPFGGVKQSGYGRERGLEAIEEYLTTKNVMINLTNEPDKSF